MTIVRSIDSLRGFTKSLKLTDRDDQKGSEVYCFRSVENVKK